jgi:3',5'-cyclic-AMP phosphodiesterase
VKAIWLTDIHFEFLIEPELRSFLWQLERAAGDAVLISGDIGKARSVEGFVSRIADECGLPVYFVLGNHDYYNGTIKDVRARIARLSGRHPLLHWMNVEDPIRLTEDTCLIGHDGWGDGQYGDLDGSAVTLNDFEYIRELRGLQHHERRDLIGALGVEAARHFERVLPMALSAYRHVLVLTHVPPFKEAAWHDGKISADDWLPFFSCKAVGDVLTAAMTKHPDHKMTVLCGHTHGDGTVRILPNLEVVTGSATYGAPEIQRVLDL